MKDLRNAILQALAIMFIMFIGAELWFAWKLKKAPLVFPGPGAADFSAHLAGDYSVHRTSGLSIMISPDGYNDGTPIIPELVAECATDGRFILAKRLGMKRRSPNDPRDTFEVIDPKVADFWILDTQAPSVDGPMNETEFINRRHSLGISDAVKLRDVYEFRPTGVGAGGE